MDFDSIRKKIEEYQASGKKLFASSSFQTHSTVMLHLLSRIDREIPVYFLNTGFLFPETLVYRDQIADLFGLNVINLYSATPKTQQVNGNGRFLYTSDPDYCCFLNKIQPMEPVLAEYDVWINGIRADQNENRKTFKTEEKTPQGAIRFHPMLDWTTRDIEAYLADYKIPRHPLEEKGYLSIGCEPCTRKLDLEIESDPRLSRWFGMKKTECGLHTELIAR